MKTLIIESDTLRGEEVKRTLNKVGLSNYRLERTVSRAINRVKNENFDLLIINLKLIYSPQIIIASSGEGYVFMCRLFEMNTLIPTIVFSDRLLDTHQVEYLKQIHYPLITEVSETRFLEDALQNLKQLNM